MSTPTDLAARIAAAEAELEQITEAARVAYRQWREIDQRQTAKAEEIKELRRQQREEQDR